MVLNEEQGIKELREKRIAYGISQGRLALASGITREYLNKIESGKMKPSKELLNTLQKELAKFNPEAPLTMLFDYVKIRFPTLWFPWMEHRIICGSQLAPTCIAMKKTAVIITRKICLYRD